MKFIRVVKFTVIGVATLIILAVAASFSVHAYLRRANERKVAIRTPNGIDEAKYVSVGGIKQWIQIRGDDRNNPVLLFLHGGPGASSLPISSGWRAWERSFIVVQWDQPGTGRTYRENASADIGALNVARMTADGLELTEEIRRYLGKSKILLVGHSWGSALGIHMIKARPEIFSAFVGTGQFVDAIENEQFNYAHVFERAQRTNNKRALEELVALGLPPWSDLEKFKTVRRLGNKLAPRSGDALNPSADFTSSGLSLIDYYYWMRSPAYNRTRFDRSILSLDLRTLGWSSMFPFSSFTARQINSLQSNRWRSMLLKSKPPIRNLFALKATIISLCLTDRMRS
jgi:pimeloyl-ACP methyl ester carboxylesterase